MEGTELGGDQQFCLRWNNFQANITSQFEALRDDEDFVDVTLACEGHRLEAHKVVLSACSPYFKELFKNNPCPHPIIFMRDCEVSHVRALLQFMYAGQVNIAQAQLTAFLRTADALQIRGLTDCSQHNDKKVNRKSPPSQLRNLLSAKTSLSTSSSKAASQTVDAPDDPDKAASRRSTINSPDAARNNLADETPSQTSSQMRPNNDDYNECTYPTIRVKTDLEATDVKTEENDILMDPGGSDRPDVKCQDFNASDLLEPKMEVMEQEASDEERSSFPHNVYYNENNTLANPFAALQGNMDLMSGMNADVREDSAEAGRWDGRRNRPVPDAVWLEQHRRALPFVLKRENERGVVAPRLIKLGEGVEIREELLRGVKWGDYRKVTRGLAAALFSPIELATCSVTGQRWSRAGQESRPTKPPLDRRRVHALISYVSRHFPDVEVSRIKQVLAYKCKENCAALRMRTARLSNCFSESTNFMLTAAARPPPCELDPPATRVYPHYEASKSPGLGECSRAGATAQPCPEPPRDPDAAQ
ncbi:BTB/POZ domain-containing protein 18-like isoform X1 [Leguminivora glycinivorella]|uniref:BTB/POZ domain-containing protein 18-like isoform X1 n=2 Tax=Leguminivora glycinivorella TaxID=1035111 RepID=UPI00200EC8B3|nr:BTB/POZ domain-containing protein 18-like isoform X1 [Leguminivora glycinivorella]